MSEPIFVGAWSARTSGAIVCWETIRAYVRQLACMVRASPEGLQRRRLIRYIHGPVAVLDVLKQPRANAAR
jgi:hypothetical protein